MAIPTEQDKNVVPSTAIVEDTNNKTPEDVKPFIETASGKPPVATDVVPGVNNTGPPGFSAVTTNQQVDAQIGTGNGSRGINTATQTTAEILNGKPPAVPTITPSAREESRSLSGAFGATAQNLGLPETTRVLKPKLGRVETLKQQTQDDIKYDERLHETNNPSTVAEEMTGGRPHGEGAMRTAIIDEVGTLPIRQLGGPGPSTGPSMEEQLKYSKSYDEARGRESASRRVAAVNVATELGLGGGFFADVQRKTASGLSPEASERGEVVASAEAREDKYASLTPFSKQPILGYKKDFFVLPIIWRFLANRLGYSKTPHEFGTAPTERIYGYKGPPEFTPTGLGFWDSVPKWMKVVNPRAVSKTFDVKRTVPSDLRRIYKEIDRAMKEGKTLEDLPTGRFWSSYFTKKGIKRIWNLSTQAIFDEKASGGRRLRTWEETTRALIDDQKGYETKLDNLQQHMYKDASTGKWEVNLDSYNRWNQSQSRKEGKTEEFRTWLGSKDVSDQELDGRPRTLGDLPREYDRPPGQFGGDFVNMMNRENQVFKKEPVTPDPDAPDPDVPDPDVPDPDVPDPDVPDPDSPDKAVDQTATDLPTTELGPNGELETVPKKTTFLGIKNPEARERVREYYAKKILKRYEGPYYRKHGKTPPEWTLEYAEEGSKFYKPPKMDRKNPEDVTGVDFMKMSTDDQDSHTKWIDLQNRSSQAKVQADESKQRIAASEQGVLLSQEQVKDFAQRQSNFEATQEATRLYRKQSLDIQNETLFLSQDQAASREKERQTRNNLSDVALINQLNTKRTEINVFSAKLSLDMIKFYGERLAEEAPPYGDPASRKKIMGKILAFQKEAKGITAAMKGNLDQTIRMIQKAIRNQNKDVSVAAQSR